MVEKLKTSAAILLALALGVVACGDDPSGTEFMAPDSIEGLIFDYEIDQAKDPFPTEGTFTIQFFTAEFYALTGDELDVPNSFGSYTYVFSGAVGEAGLSDVALGEVVMTMTTQSSTGGIYVIRSPDAVQRGTFAMAEALEP